LSQNNRQSRRDLLEIYQAGIAAADGRRRVTEALAGAAPPTGGVHLFAIGKAAPAMALGAHDAWGGAVVDGLIITRRGHLSPELARRTGWRQLEAAHPLPDAGSLAAGTALLQALAATERGATCLFLISGGSSSLVEVLPPGVSLTDLQRANDWLLASGLDIGGINAVRRALSAIKGGRLLGHLAGRQTLALYLSDVPGDRVWDIGSGLLAAAPGGTLPPGLPAWLAALLTTGTDAGDAAGPAADPAVTQRVVASSATALIGCEAAAARRYDHVVRHERRLDCPVGDAAGEIVATLLRGPPGVYLWGGETTLQLPEDPGRGGRCQQLALRCALELAGRPGLAVLCGATDGSDGPGEDAGGLVDDRTIARGEAEGLSGAACLAAADAGRFLAAAGDLISTGPTGTNVNDLVVGLRAAAG
jgi:hydroxypyruvate reductase